MSPRPRLARADTAALGVGSATSPLPQPCTPHSTLPTARSWQHEHAAETYSKIHRWRPLSVSWLHPLTPVFARSLVTGLNVKYRNSSSRLISGNDRNCSYCSQENIFSDTRLPPPHRTNQTERSGGDLQRGVAFDINAGRRHIRPKFVRGYGHPLCGSCSPGSSISDIPPTFRRERPVSAYSTL